MTHPGNRNAAIAAAYRGGALLRELAEEHGLSMSRISYIVKQQGARLTGEDLHRRCSQHSVRIARDPVVRAKIGASLRLRWQNGERVGRERILANDPARREDYLALRDACGAAYARQAMGISA